MHRGSAAVTGYDTQKWPFRTPPSHRRPYLPPFGIKRKPYAAATNTCERPAASRSRSKQAASSTAAADNRNLCIFFNASAAWYCTYCSFFCCSCYICVLLVWVRSTKENRLERLATRLPTALPRPPPLQHQMISKTNCTHKKRFKIPLINLPHVGRIIYR